MPSRRKTYLLAGQHKVLSKYCELADWHLHHKARAVCVVSRKADPPPAHTIVQELEGDKRKDYIEWATRNRLDELFLEHHELDRHDKRGQKRAIERWKQARQDRAEAQRKLKRAEKREYAANAALVRFFGRGPIVIDGVTYDPSHTYETVYYVPRRGPNSERK